MNESPKAFGTLGETGAVSYLESQGYSVIDANVRPLGGMARGEIDLIAWQGDTLVFIEVKTRRTALGNQGTPAEAVGKRKRKQIVFLATAYLAKHGLDDVPCRFDVIELVRERSSPPRFHLIRNAFDATDCGD